MRTIRLYTWGGDANSLKDGSPGWLWDVALPIRGSSMSHRGFVETDDVHWVHFNVPNDSVGGTYDPAYEAVEGGYVLRPHHAERIPANPNPTVPIARAV